MDRDDIIAMAREAGLCTWLNPPNYVSKCFERFAALVAAAEREACAKVCEEIMKEHDPFDRQAGIARYCATEIRARGQA